MAGVTHVKISCPSLGRQASEHSFILMRMSSVMPESQGSTMLESCTELHFVLSSVGKAFHSLVGVSSRPSPHLAFGGLVDHVRTLSSHSRLKPQESCVPPHCISCGSRKTFFSLLNVPFPQHGCPSPLLCTFIPPGAAGQRPPRRCPNVLLSVSSKCLPPSDPPMEYRAAVIPLFTEESLTTPAVPTTFPVPARPQRR